MRSAPTMTWVIGVTVAIAALTPVVGQVASNPPAVSAAPASPSPRSAPSNTAVDTPRTPTTSPTSATPPPTTERVTVGQGTTPLGLTAVDDQGHTLYLSTLDRRNPPYSVCLSDRCLASWKPLYLPNATTAPLGGNSVDQALIGSFKRQDGTWQATLAGWPLYLFDKDQKPGDVNGEGLKGTWHAINPQGQRVVQHAQ